MIRLLMINYFESSLIRELSRLDYVIKSTKTNRGVRLAISDISRNIDMIYFGKFNPPELDDFDILFNHTNIPIVYGLHGPSIITKPYRPSNYIHNFISAFKIAHMRIGRRISAIHVLNYDEYKQLKFVGLNPFYIPLGIDTTQFIPKIKNDRFTIVFVSARYAKGVDMLIKVIPNILKKAPDVSFMLLGTGYAIDYFNQLKRSFSPNIQVIENLPREEFIKMFSSAHLLLFLSRWESYGIVVPEALSSGMPVVCFDIAGAPRDIVKRYNVGKIAKPFTTQSIVDSVIEYYELWKNNPKEFRLLSSKCRNVALRYDWKIIVKLFDQMFKQVSKN